MSREKQIEEMAKAMCGNGMSNGNCVMDDEPCNLECVYGYCAERLHAKDYRKQSEGEWIVTDADSGSFGEYEPFIEFKCSKCESCYGIESGQYDWQYGEPIPWVACPLCGAEMKGGAEE